MSGVERGLQNDDEPLKAAWERGPDATDEGLRPRLKPTGQGNPAIVCSAMPDLCCLASASWSAPRVRASRPARVSSPVWPIGRRPGGWPSSILGSGTARFGRDGILRGSNAGGPVEPRAAERGRPRGAGTAAGPAEDGAMISVDRVAASGGGLLRWCLSAHRGRGGWIAQRDSRGADRY
jgi:hypothetical protein